MTRTAIIGVGHLAEYMIVGLRNGMSAIPLRLFSRRLDLSRELSARYGDVKVFETAQQAVDGADVVIVATRPNDVAAALEGISFSQNQVVVSVAAGVTVAQLQALVGPAIAVRALPISCVAINKSPTLLFPENALARHIFAQLGQVHVLENEEQFAPATAVVGAFYAWMFPLMDHVATWAHAAGLDEKMARGLLIETIEGACGMAKQQADHSFDEIWRSLATPGGISELGLTVIEARDGLSAWGAALDAVGKRLSASKP